MWIGVDHLFCCTLCILASYLALSSNLLCIVVVLFPPPSMRQTGWHNLWDFRGTLIRTKKFRPICFLRFATNHDKNIVNLVFRDKNIVSFLFLKEKCCYSAKQGKHIVAPCFSFENNYVCRIGLNLIT